MKKTEMGGTCSEYGQQERCIQGFGGALGSMKNFNDTIWNRTRVFPACSAVSQPTVPPRASNIKIY
jgi:hypothetical protein